VADRPILQAADYAKRQITMQQRVIRSMGFLLVQMVLEEDSFLKKAVEWESAKLVA